MNDNDSILNETNTGDSSIRPSEIDYEDYDLVRPSQSSTAQYLKNLDTKIKNANLTKDTLLSDFDSVINDTLNCLTKTICSTTSVEGIWNDYLNLREKRDKLIDEYKANPGYVKQLIKEYDIKENEFYKVICENILRKYNHNLADCKFIDDNSIYLYRNLVESGRSVSKLFNIGVYSRLNSCLGIKAPELSNSDYLSRMTSQLRNTVTGNTVRGKYGGKKLTKNRVRRKVTKRRKVLKRRKLTKRRKPAIKYN